MAQQAIHKRYNFLSELEKLAEEQEQLEGSLIGLSDSESEFIEKMGEQSQSKRRIMAYLFFSGRRTVAQAARNFGVNKAHVYKHLMQLTDKGLVNRIDEGRKWIYYELNDCSKSFRVRELLYMYFK